MIDFTPPYSKSKFSKLIIYSLCFFSIYAVIVKRFIRTKNISIDVSKDSKQTLISLLNAAEKVLSKDILSDKSLFTNSVLINHTLIYHTLFMKYGNIAVNQTLLITPVRIFNPINILNC